MTINEGVTANYTMALSARPAAEVTVTPRSGDPGAVSVSGALTFTTENWATAQEVTVTGVQDADDSDETVTVTHTAAGGGYDGVSASVTVEVVDVVNGADTGVCDRTPQVRDAIFDVLNKRVCEDITAADLASIKRLPLSGKAITALKGGDFAGLSGLEELNLGNNALAILPGDVFAGLSNLKKLNLYGNGLAALPVKVFAGLSNLEELILGDNNLTALDVSLFAGLSRLGWLDLAGNRLTSLPSWVFRGLVNLKRLDLQENRLTALPLDIFAGLTNLGVLYLERNQLSTLPAGIFAELSSLRRLNLEHNRLNTLPDGLFTGVSLGSGLILGPDLYLPLGSTTYLGLGSNPGAPFTLTLQLERRDHSRPSVPDPATVGVALAPDGHSPMSVPLPFDLPLSLGVKAGIYAPLTRAAPIQAGRTASDDVTVYQRHPNLNVPIADPVTVSLHVGSWIDSSPHGLRTSGISIAAGKPLVLFGGDFGLFDDEFSSNVALSEASSRRDGSNAGAGKETGEPDHAGNSGGASVWWTWTAPATGSVTFDTRGSDFDTLLAVYTGDGLNRLAEVASNDDASEEERQSSVRFRVEQGQTYHIAVDGYDGETGAIVLNWQTAPISETFIASVEVSIPGPNGLMAVGRDITWIAPAPEVDGLATGWNLNKNSNGDLHGLQIHVDDTKVAVEQWLNGVRQVSASYRDGKPFGVFTSYANGELEGLQYLIGEKNWTFVTFRNGKLHGSFGPYVNGEPKGDFGTFSDGELEGMLHTIGEEGWSFEVYRADTRHGPYGNYNSDGQKNGPFGIYTNGNKDPGEVYWENGEREPGTENRPPLPIPDNVPEEITFADFTDSLDLASNLFLKFCNLAFLS